MRVSISAMANRNKAVELDKKSEPKTSTRTKGLINLEFSFVYIYFEIGIVCIWLCSSWSKCQQQKKKNAWLTAKKRTFFLLNSTNICLVHFPTSFFIHLNITFLMNSLPILGLFRLRPHFTNRCFMLLYYIFTGDTKRCVRCQGSGGRKVCFLLIVTRRKSAVVQHQ